MAKLGACKPKPYRPGYLEPCERRSGFINTDDVRKKLVRKCHILDLRRSEFVPSIPKTSIEFLSPSSSLFETSVMNSGLPSSQREGCSQKMPAPDRTRSRTEPRTNALTFCVFKARTS
ncbi:hypothetical protein RRG08_060207 [Elysia crispata]|uniref:Uncharacterized protein n=1 Tax=Elysia crispata TaxID=231223 RepID=A0AAE1D0V2_9GAST|nr:hypothetical protein RRG08_060207 [Elysia crispata]